MAGQDRPWAYWLLFSIHIADDLVRTGFLIFLPFLLRDKGADLPTIGLGLSLLFAGGAAGKLVMGWVGEQLGVVPSVILTEVATTVLILAAAAAVAAARAGAAAGRRPDAERHLVGALRHRSRIRQSRAAHARFRDLLHRRLGGRRHRAVPLGLAGRCRGPADRARGRVLHRAHHRADGVGAAAGLPAQLSG